MSWLTAGRPAMEGAASTRYHTADRGEKFGSEHPRAGARSRGRPACAEGGVWAPAVDRLGMDMLGSTHFWSTKMPTMRLKEIRSAVTHMRQYSSGGCGERTQGQLPVRAHP